MVGAGPQTEGSLYVLPGSWYRVIERFASGCAGWDDSIKILGDFHVLSW